MTEKKTYSGQTDTLRQRAEDVFREKAARMSENLEALSPEETRQILHELRVHQIELEMQNEELRRAQAELDASRARYFDLYDLAPVGYFTLSETGLILEANLTAATLLRVERSTLVRQLLTRFILPEDQDIYYRHRKQLFETGAPQLCELRLVKKDASPFWVRIDASAAYDADGAPVCRTIISDITERRRAEEARQESERQIRFQAELLRNAPVIAAFHDRDLNVIWANKAYEDATGLSAQTMAGRKCYSVWKLAKACCSCPVVNAIETGEFHEAELTPQNQDHWPESQGYWLSRAAPVRAADGSILGAIEIAIDITERWRAEEVIREKVAELERWRTVTLGREDRIGALKREINELLASQGQPPRYPSEGV